jgi:WD40 repeat protein
VHDVAFDLHAQRIATCSSDQKIRIWERIEVLTEPVQTTPWQCTSEVKGAHKGAVWRVCWADPEYGQIFASSGNDMKICIYKEKEQVNSKVWENLWEI